MDCVPLNPFQPPARAQAIRSRKRSLPGFDGRLIRLPGAFCDCDLPEVPMAQQPTVTILLVNANEVVSRALELQAGTGDLQYRWLAAASRQDFLSLLENEQPHLIFLSESGIPDLSSEEVFTAARRADPEIPVIMFGMRRRERSVLTLIREGVWDYLRLNHMERLAVIVERTLRERQYRIRQSQVENDFRRATALLQENERLATVGRLAGSIAHEINNPLESLTNLLFLTKQEQGLPPAVKGYLLTAEEELKRVIQITRQTLNFCRETPVPAALRLGELLDQVLALYAHRIAEKRLEVVRHLEEREPILVFPGEMRQVFSNLIANAIEASFEGGRLQVSVRRSRLWKDPEVVGQRVMIADSGAGMPPDVRHRIGELFFTTKGQNGTGLGLWITQSILKRYGGNLFLRSSIGEHHGTVFSVFLPSNLRPRVIVGGKPVHASNGLTMGQATSRSAPDRQRPSSHAKGA